MIYCYYHSVDLDGQSSAAIIKKYIPEAILKPYNYGKEFNFEKFTKDDTVYFADVVLQPFDDLLKLYEIIGDNLYIFDHHNSFLISDAHRKLQELIPQNLNCNAIFAGCELTWQYITDDPMPPAIHLLGQYDSWRSGHKKLIGDYDWDNEVMPFQFGMRLNKFNPEKPQHLENILDRANIKEIIEKGNTILKYQTSQNKITMAHSFDAKVDEYDCLVVNGGLRNSDVFKSKWDNEKYHCMVAFSLKKNQEWSWSFYTDREDVDVSKLASQYGGGGHKGAAGCVTKELIFSV